MQAIDNPDNDPARSLGNLQPLHANGQNDRSLMQTLLNFDPGTGRLVDCQRRIDDWRWYAEKRLAEMCMKTNEIWFGADRRQRYRS